MLASYLIVMIFSALFFGAVLAVVLADAVQAPISLLEALRRSLPRLPSLYGLTLLFAALAVLLAVLGASSQARLWYPWFMLASLGRAIVTIITAAIWAPSGGAVVQEGLGLLAALRRGARLSRGSRITIGLISLFNQLGIGAPTLVIYMFQLTQPWWLPRVIALGAQVLVGVVWLTAETVIYLQLRERAEGLAVGGAAQTFD